MLRSIAVYRQITLLVVRRNLLSLTSASSRTNQPLKTLADTKSQRLSFSSLSYQDPIFKEKHTQQKTIPVEFDDHYNQQYHQEHHQDVISASSSSLVHHETMVSNITTDGRRISSIHQHEHHHHVTSVDEDTDFPLFKTKTESTLKQRQKSDEEIYGVIMDY